MQLSGRLTSALSGAALLLATIIGGSTAFAAPPVVEETPAPVSATASPESTPSPASEPVEADATPTPTDSVAEAPEAGDESIEATEAADESVEATEAGDESVESPAAHEATTTPAEEPDADAAASEAAPQGSTATDGALAITVSVKLPSGVAPKDGLTFSGQYTCEHPGDPAQTGGWSLTLPEPATVDGLRADSTCTVTADEASGAAADKDPSHMFTGAPAITPTTVTTVAGETTAVAVAYETSRVLTGFTVTKQKLVGDDESLLTDQVYQFSWECIDATGAKHWGTGEPQAGGSFTAGDIPVGSTCVVEEILSPDLPGGYEWQPVEFKVEGASDVVVTDPKVADRVSFTLVAPGQSGSGAEVSVTNYVARQYGAYQVSKTSNPPSGTVVKPGDVITYTLTFTPKVNGLIKNVVITDDLAEVLPYADVTITASDEGNASISGTTLTWKVGDLVVVEELEPFSITYQAKVKSGQWGVALLNTASVTGEVEPMACPECQLSTKHPTAQKPKPTLPQTGAPDVALSAGLGLSAVVLGVTALAAARRRERQE